MFPAQNFTQKCTKGASWSKKKILIFKIFVLIIEITVHCKSQLNCVKFLNDVNKGKRQPSVVQPLQSPSRCCRERAELSSKRLLMEY